MKRGNKERVSLTLDAVVHGEILRALEHYPSRQKSLVLIEMLRLGMEASSKGYALGSIPLAARPVVRPLVTASEPEAKTPAMAPVTPSAARQSVKPAPRFDDAAPVTSKESEAADFDDPSPLPHKPTINPQDREAVISFLDM
jgi:hypothetical protein